MDPDEDWPGGEEIHETGSGKDGSSSKDGPSSPSKDGPSSSTQTPFEKILQSFTSPSKQLTLAKTLQNQGSPVQIIKRSSPGAKKRPSLLESLSAQKINDVAKAKEEAAKVRLEGVEGESLPQEEIKNGSRDRLICAFSCLCFPMPPP